MLNILPFKQSDSSRCGPASIKAVLYYYGIDITEDEICLRCEHTYELGCTNDNIKSAIESYGLGCSIIEMVDTSDLEYWTRHGVPVIVDWFTPGFNQGLEDLPNGHASVVIGVDREKVYLMDPEIGQVRPISHSDFMRCWFDWVDPLISKAPNNLTVRQGIITFPGRLYA